MLVNAVWQSGLCMCNCHHADEKPPPAVDARLCQECADERFAPWNELISQLLPR